MFKKIIFRVTILLITIAIVAPIFFTGFCLNLFKDETTNYLLSKLDVDSLDYDYIQGNLISGFSVSKVLLDSEKYSFRADLVQSSISIIDIIKMLKRKNKEIYIYEPLIKNKNSLMGCRIINDLLDFKNKTDLIISNRMSIKLKDVLHKVYTRDVFGEN